MPLNHRHLISQLLRLLASTIRTVRWQCALWEYTQHAQVWGRWPRTDLGEVTQDRLTIYLVPVHRPWLQDRVCEMQRCGDTQKTKVSMSALASFPIKPRNNGILISAALSAAGLDCESSGFDFGQFLGHKGLAAGMRDRRARKKTSEGRTRSGRKYRGGCSTSLRPCNLYQACNPFPLCGVLTTLGMIAFISKGL